MDKKHVVYFVPEFPKISETFIEREISKLIQQGSLEITVLSLAKASGSTSQDVLNRVVYKRISGKDVLAGLAYLVIKTRNVLKALQLVTPVSPYKFIKALGYTKVLEDLNPNHIHVHFLSWPSTTVMIASTILDIPYSISAHARDVFMEGELIPKKIGSAKFLCICNSYAYKKALELAGPNADTSKVHLIYHGVDPSIFAGEAKLAKSTAPRIFLGGTRLVEKKGLTYMIAASKILRSEGVEHVVDLVGPGSLYQELLNQINEAGLEDTVFIHGGGAGTPFNEVLEYYKAADVFVLPSIETGAGDADGVPTVVIEAAMAKLPIVSTNAGGISDLIEDGITGLVVEQRNPKAIAEAVKKLLQNRELANKLAQNACAKAINMFDLDKNIGQLEGLLTQ